MRYWPALLTGTIIPNAQALGRLIDPSQREQQYLATLTWMAAAATGVDKVVFCENSSAGLEAFERFPALYSKYGRTIEIKKVPMPQNEDFRGKGWGEGMIIRWALDNAKTLNEPKSFVKITGRHQVLNLSRILTVIRQGLETYPEIKFICQTFSCSRCISSVIGPVINTEFFWSDRDFFQQYLVDAYEEVDDREGIYFEHVLARRLIELSGRFEFGVLPLPVIIRGVWGYNAKPVTPRIKRVKELIRQTVYPLPRLKRLAISPNSL